MGQPAVVMPVEITVKNEWCKGCGICVGFCPKNVLSMNDDGKAYVAHPEKCAECGKCELYCPDFAIAVWRNSDEKPQKITAR